jgi:outer membrane autotransporter protein
MRHANRWRGLAIGALATAGLIGLWAVPASAQAIRDDGDCDDIVISTRLPFYDQNSPLNCYRSLAATHALVYQSEVIRNIVGRRLITPPFADEISPAGFSYDSHAAAQQVLRGGRTFTIAPTADVPAAAPVRKWNVWGDGKMTWLDPGDTPAPPDGTLTNVSAGIDYKITDKVVFGLLASYENSDLDTDALLSKTNTDGYGGGAYVGITLTENLVFSGMVTGAHIDTDSDFLGASADINSDRIQASAGVTGYWYFGKTRLSPSVTIAWSKEWQDDFTDSFGLSSPDQTTETAVLTLGDQIGHTFSLDGGMTIEPWIGAYFDWTFVNEVKTDGLPSYYLDDSYDLRLQSGLILNIAPNAQLSLTGEIGGLVMPDDDTYSGEANLAIQF